MFLIFSKGFSYFSVLIFHSGLSSSPVIPIRKQDNCSIMTCFSLQSLHGSPGILQCVTHTLFLLSPTFFFFQKDCSSLSFNYGVLKDSSDAFMPVNCVLLIAPYSLDFVIPQISLSWNWILLYSCIVRTYILLFSM